MILETIRSEKLSNPQNLFFGANCHINHLTCWQPGAARIRVGDRLLCGPGTMLFGSNYDLASSDLRSRPSLSADITIGDDVWLGAGVTVVDGVTIGRGSIIGAGAVVTTDIPPYSIAIGIPAKPVKDRRQMEKNDRQEAGVFFGELEQFRDKQNANIKEIKQ